MAAPQAEKKVYQVAVLLYHGADILDFAGPIEMLSAVSYNRSRTAPERAFKINLVGRAPNILAGGCMKIDVDIGIEEALKRLDSFDILIVPGGNAQQHAARTTTEYEFIKTFVQLQQAHQGGEERVLLSVCTGALIVAATGAFGGRKATTHHMCYDQLKAIDGSIDVIDCYNGDRTRRYVDSGLSKSGLRVVSAGGVTCGMDAALYIAELKVGLDAAQSVARRSEFDWMRAELPEA